ncbi:MAG: hypothetical protein HKN00_05910 [Flavobacteriaceae bacterium]|nr:hypothetical protein [Bacteroidia bacterium]MBT8287182.1 hypothetical protein [Bacteroidia bacterium]NNF74699.1 hypothetical protein [Flavobacteriaceae bacterium]NNK72191.1 hypothetical protein [Flavobacteriaceae bacterium]
MEKHIQIRNFYLTKNVFCLGTIVVEITNDELLGNIFGNFCIGSKAIL